MNQRPIAITMGDPTGVGPETIVRAWPRAHRRQRRPLLVVGRPEVIHRAVRLVGEPLELAVVDSPEEVRSTPRRICCLVSGRDSADSAPPGAPDARAGRAAHDAVSLAAELALAGRVAAMVTAPICKSALWLAGERYPGHTEMLAELCGVDHFAMMLYLAADSLPGRKGGFAVAHVTLHTALRNVPAMITQAGVLSKIRLLDAAMVQIEAKRPRIGVCALNCHAGEDGLFGREEIDHIRPAVEASRRDDIDATGPLPADTLMRRAAEGEFDAVVAMYHDQGHIAVKLLDMRRAVNVTLGLPIIRTSVAHGTAFDRAWQGSADGAGMVEAIATAARLADRWAAAPIHSTRPTTGATTII